MSVKKHEKAFHLSRAPIVIPILLLRERSLERSEEHSSEDQRQIFVVFHCDQETNKSKMFLTVNQRKEKKDIKTIKLQIEKKWRLMQC